MPERFETYHFSTGCRYPLQISTGAWELLTLFLTSHKSFLLFGILNEHFSFQATPCRPAARQTCLVA